MGWTIIMKVLQIEFILENFTITISNSVLPISPSLYIYAIFMQPQLPLANTYGIL